MNSALWFCQALLALLFAYSGWMKSTRSASQLVAIGQTGMENLTTPLIRFIGISELVGVVGLLVPWYTQIIPILTPVAALCLGLIMIPAGIIHYQRNEKRTVGVNAAILLLCLFVTYGRYTQMT